MQARYYLNFRSTAETTVTCLKSVVRNIKPYSTSNQSSDIQRVQSYLETGTAKRYIRTNTMKLRMTNFCTLTVHWPSFRFVCDARDFCCSLYKKFKVNDVTCRSARRPTDNIGAAHETLGSAENCCTRRFFTAVCPLMYC
jgi:hypothetical protein